MLTHDSPHALTADDFKNEMIVKHRKSIGMSQEALAKATGLSRTVIHHAEKGLASCGTLKQIAAVYGIHWLELIRILPSDKKI